MKKVLTQFLAIVGGIIIIFIVISLTFLLHVFKFLRNKVYKTFFHSSHKHHTNPIDLSLQKIEKS